MKLNKALITLILLLCAILFSGTVEHTYYFNAGEIKAVKTSEGYDILSFVNAMNTAKAGEPSIPYHSVSLLLPPGETAGAIEIIPSDKVTLEGKYAIYPQQHSQPVSKGKSGIFVKDEKLYRTNAVYPENKTGVLSTHFMNGYSFAMSAFTPAEYNPVTGEFSVYQKVTVKITSSSDKNPSDALKNLKLSENLIKSIKKLDQNNGSSLNIYRSKADSKVTDSYDYLIVTSDAYKNSFSPLLDFYNGRGINTRIISTTEIYSSAAGSDNQEKIRNYIIGEYQNCGIEFVLLGGDIELVPARGFYCSVQSSELYEDYAIPSDIYFSSLDGNWNNDSDNKWAEIGEDDLLPEISVARFTFSNGTELTSLINKTLKYQSEPVLGELRDPLIAGEWLYDDPESWGSDYLELLIGYRDENGYITSGIPEDHTITKMYDEDGEWSTSDLIAEINAGHSFIHHDGHANYTYAMRMDINDVTNANFSTVNGTTHNYTLVYTSGCMCGGFDENDCIAEKFVSIENFAAAFVGNSRYGWFNEGQTEGPSIHIHREFVDALYGDRTAEIGKAHKESKIDTAPWVNAPGQWEEGAIRWCFYDCNVLGDPAMNIWTDEPENISLTYNNSINIGQEEYTLNVKNTENEPLSEISCALIQNGQIFGYAKTDISGNAVINLDGVYELGEAELKISGYNTLLQSHNISIIPNEGKYITIESCRIDAEGDDLIEFGETVSISLTLKNAGLTAAQNVLFNITESNELIQLSGITENIGNINAGDTLRVENAFSFTVSESIPDLYEFTINSRLYDTEEEWLRSISFIGKRPVLEVNSIGISDGNDNVLDPGETGNIVVSLTNSGHGKANNLSALLSTLDDRITVNEPQQLQNILSPDQTAELSFNISAEDTGTNGYTTEFKCAVAGDNNLNFEHSFFIEIGSQRDGFETGDFSSYDWYFEGELPWVIDAAQAYAGSYSARSGSIGNNQTSSLMLNCDIANGGEISFYYKTSSEANYDALLFYVDGVQIYRWSGISPTWKPASYTVTSGEHIFKWTYKKDGSATGGEDRVWIDSITFPGMNEPTSINPEEKILPTVTSLFQNYPNPFNPVTEISYSLSEKASVSLSVYNMKGEHIKTLADGTKERGLYKTEFGSDNINSGIYFYKLTVNGRIVDTKRMLLIK